MANTFHILTYLFDKLDAEELCDWLISAAGIESASLKKQLKKKKSFEFEFKNL